MTNNLLRKSAGAFLWDIGGTVFKHGIGFIISIILARLLSPNEFGLIAMAMVVIAVSEVFTDIGFTAALIQRQDVNALTFSSVFYLNLVLAIFLTAIVFMIAPFVADFYRNDKITAIIRLLSLIFIFNAFSVVQISFLKRKLKFKLLTYRSIVAGIVGGVAGVLGALNGLGVYSLVAQVLITALVNSIILWVLSSWKPTLMFSFKEIRKLSMYSMYTFFDRFFSILFQKVDVVFIGRVFSPSTLGFYSTAQNISNYTNTYSSSSLLRVYFPVLSRAQNDDELFKQIYFRVSSLIAFVAFFLTGILFIIAEPLIVNLFGGKWLQAVPLFQILIFKSFNPPINSMMLNAMLSKGKAKENFKIGIVRKLIRLMPIGIGLVYGLIPFVWAVVCVSYLLTFYNIFFLQKYLGINAAYHVRKIFEGLLPLVMLFFVGDLIKGDLLQTTLVAVMFAVLYLIYARIIGMEGMNLAIEGFKKIRHRFN